MVCLLSVPLKSIDNLLSVTFKRYTVHLMLWLTVKVPTEQMELTFQCPALLNYVSVSKICQLTIQCPTLLIYVSVSKICQAHLHNQLKALTKACLIKLARMQNYLWWCRDAEPLHDPGLWPRRPAGEDPLPHLRGGEDAARQGRGFRLQDPTPGRGPANMCATLCLFHSLII